MNSRVWLIHIVHVVPSPLHYVPQHRRVMSKSGAHLQPPETPQAAQGPPGNLSDLRLLNAPVNTETSITWHRITRSSSNTTGRAVKLPVPVSVLVCVSGGQKGQRGHVEDFQQTVFCTECLHMIPGFYLPLVDGHDTDIYFRTLVNIPTVPEP